MSAELVVEEILRLNDLGNYIKVAKENWDSVQSDTTTILVREVINKIRVYLKDW